MSYGVGEWESIWNKQKKNTLTFDMYKQNVQKKRKKRIKEEKKITNDEIRNINVCKCVCVSEIKEMNCDRRDKKQHHIS